MMQDITARISLPVSVLMIALGCGGRPPTENTRPTPLPVPSPPAPAPVSTYHVSGVATDDNDSRVANAQLALYYNSAFRTEIAKTSTDARGYYSITFETAQRAFDGNDDVVGVIYYTGGGDYENYYVQALPWGTADIVKNLHLRHVRNVNAGQSLVVSIDADSSLAYDGDDWMDMGSVWEKFHVRAARAGTLKVTFRPVPAGIVPQIGVLCVHVADNCLNGWVDAPPGTAARRVQANSLFEIRVAIPVRMTPQRYELATSLE